MSVYKKGINKKEEASNIEYVFSNNLGVYINMPINYKDFTPYHGLYITQEEFNSVICLDRVIEEIEIGKEKICLEQELSGGKEAYNGGFEYLEELCLQPVPSEKYLCKDVLVMKQYILSEKEKVLCISYDITNNSNDNIKFRSYPCVTQREVFDTKRKSLLKLTCNKTQDGTKVTLSIRENRDLYLKSRNSKCVHKENYLEGVEYNFPMDKDKLKTYINDLYIPSYFEVEVKKKNSQKVEIFVALENIDLEQYSSEQMLKDVIQKNEDITAQINEKYYELKSMAISANSLNYIDKKNKKFVILDSIPFKKDKNDYVSNLITSIEGNYIILGRLKQAGMILSSIPAKINHEVENGNISKLEELEAVLIYIDIVNKYLSKADCDDGEKARICEYIKKVMDRYLDSKPIYISESKEDIDKNNDDVYINEKGMVVYKVGSKERIYLKVNCLWFNALKVYINLIGNGLYKNDEIDYIKKIYDISDKLQKRILEDFWDEQNRVLKYELNESSEASSDMLYALCLSNPLVYDLVAMKIIDTIFKELYTPYGLRKFNVKSGQYDGYVYPHLMANFVKANLRLNGVTRATQKISYNLVKELLLEITKSNVGSVKYMYDEKTKKGFGPAISGITNSEMIRLFDMLT